MQRVFTWIYRIDTVTVDVHCFVESDMSVVVVFHVSKACQTNPMSMSNGRSATSSHLFPLRQGGP